MTAEEIKIDKTNQMALALDTLIHRVRVVAQYEYRGDMEEFLPEWQDRVSTSINEIIDLYTR